MEKPVELSDGFPERISDFWLQNANSLKPFVLLLFAVPRVSGIQEAGVQMGFHIDDLESAPPEGGGGLIDLKYHWIFRYIYHGETIIQGGTTRTVDYLNRDVAEK